LRISRTTQPPPCHIAERAIDDRTEPRGPVREDPVKLVQQRRVKAQEKRAASAFHDTGLAQAGSRTAGGVWRHIDPQGGAQTNAISGRLVPDED
jgi:hypothetical protein